VRGADVARVDDLSAASKRLDGFGAQQAVRIGDDAERFGCVRHGR